MISKGYFSNFSWLFSYIHFYERKVFERNPSITVRIKISPKTRFLRKILRFWKKTFACWPKLRQIDGVSGGEMAEWSIAHAWKACVVKSNREFESLSLRHYTWYFLIFPILWHFRIIFMKSCAGFCFLRFLFRKFVHLTKKKKNGYTRYGVISALKEMLFIHWLWNIAFIFFRCYKWNIIAF